MTNRERDRVRRSHLLGAGWIEGCRWAPAGQTRPPERWYRPGEPIPNAAGYTLGVAYKLCLADAATSLVRS